MLYVQTTSSRLECMHVSTSYADNCNISMKLYRAHTVFEKSLNQSHSLDEKENIKGCRDEKLSKTFPFSLFIVYPTTPQQRAFGRSSILNHEDLYFRSQLFDIHHCHVCNRSTIAIRNMQAFPVASANGIVSLFLHTSSGSPFTSAFTSETTSHLQQDNIVPNTQSGEHASAPVSDFSVGMSRSTKPYIDSNTVEHINPRPAKVMASMFTYFIPTSKCPKDYYCSAQMTIYQDFTGVTSS